MFCFVLAKLCLFVISVGGMSAGAALAGCVLFCDVCVESADGVDAATRPAGVSVFSVYARLPRVTGGHVPTDIMEAAEYRQAVAELRCVRVEASTVEIEDLD